MEPVASRSQRCSVWVQVVAGLLHNRFPNATIQADQVVGSNFLLAQHLEQAQTPGTSQYETLAPDSKEHWDAVIFQVCHLNCRGHSWPLSCTCALSCSGVSHNPCGWR